MIPSPKAATFVAVLALAAPAHAIAVRDIINKACALASPGEDTAISAEQVARAVLVAHGISTTAVSGTNMPDALLKAVACADFTNDETRELPVELCYAWQAYVAQVPGLRGQNNAMAATLHALAAHASAEPPQKAIALRIDPVPERVSKTWWRDTGGKAMFTCRVPARPETDLPATLSIKDRLSVAGNTRSLFVRQTNQPDPDPAQFTFVRSRDVGDQGTKSETRKVSINTVAGILLGASQSNPALLYLGYRNSVARVSPNPNGLAQGSDDIEIIDLGLSLRRSLGPAYLTVEGGNTFDLADDASRLRGGLQLEYVGPRFDQAKPFINGLFRPFAAAQVEFSKVWRRGTSDLGSGDSFLLVGPVIGFDVMPGWDEAAGNFGDGLTIGLRYRSLFSIAGDAPEIHRLEARIAHRWAVGDAAVDMGLGYKRGRDPLSFKREDELSLSVGFLY
jgi:hypothetical protein